MKRKFTWTEDDGSVWTYTIAGWIFLSLTILSAIAIIGIVLYCGLYYKPESKEVNNAAVYLFIAIGCLITGVISTPFCTKCVKTDKTISQVLKELIHIMTWGI